MTNKEFDARVQLKYDTYSNWTTNNPTPLQGELCIVYVPENTGVVAQEPAILFKVGDGNTSFNNLDYVKSIAGDVYDWAKTETKPTYTSNEIDGLDGIVTSETDETDNPYIG